jgi:hypothetical protein
MNENKLITVIDPLLNSTMKLSSGTLTASSFVNSYQNASLAIIPMFPSRISIIKPEIKNDEVNTKMIKLVKEIDTSNDSTNLETIFKDDEDLKAKLLTSKLILRLIVRKLYREINSKLINFKNVRELLKNNENKLIQSLKLYKSRYPVFFELIKTYFFYYLNQFKLGKKISFSNEIKTLFDMDPNNYEYSRFLIDSESTEMARFRKSDLFNYINNSITSLELKSIILNYDSVGFVNKIKEIIINTDVDKKILLFKFLLLNKYLYQIRRNHLKVSPSFISESIFKHFMKIFPKSIDLSNIQNNKQINILNKLFKDFITSPSKQKFFEQTFFTIIIHNSYNIITGRFFKKITYSFDIIYKNFINQYLTITGFYLPKEKKMTTFYSKFLNFLFKSCKEIIPNMKLTLIRQNYNKKIQNYCSKIIKVEDNPIVNTYLFFMFIVKNMSNMCNFFINSLENDPKKKIMIFHKTGVIKQNQRIKNTGATKHYDIYQLKGIKIWSDDVYEYGENFFNDYDNFNLTNLKRFIDLVLLSCQTNSAFGHKVSDFKKKDFNEIERVFPTEPNLVENKSLFPKGGVFIEYFFKWIINSLNNTIIGNDYSNLYLDLRRNSKIITMKDTLGYSNKEIKNTVEKIKKAKEADEKSKP